MASAPGETDAKQVFGSEEITWLANRKAAHHAVAHVLSTAN
jgi:hypothetical protein